MSATENTPIVEAETATPVEVVSVEPIVSLNSGTQTFQSVGEWLKLARETQKLSIGDIAAKLRMGVKQVQALEASDYSTLPKGTFLRGFVRNYAKSVGLNQDAVLEMLARTNPDASPAAASQVVVPVQQNIRVTRTPINWMNPNAWLGGVLVLAIAGAGYYWWEFIRKPRAAVAQTLATPAPLQPAVSAPAAAPTPPAPTDSTSSAIGTPPSESPADATKTAVDSVAQPTIAPAPVDPVPAPVVPSPEKNIEKPLRKGTALVGFTFSGDSWVEVVDATGRTVLSRKYQAGEADEVIGRPPFSITVGHANVTRMAYNGREVDLTPHTRGAVARMSLK